MSTEHGPIGRLKSWLRGHPDGPGTITDPDAVEAAPEPPPSPMPPGPAPGPGVEAALPPRFDPATAIEPTPAEVADETPDGADDAPPLDGFGSGPDPAPVGAEAGGRPEDVSEVVENSVAGEPPVGVAVHALWAPKLGDDESEWEDAFAFDERLGLAAVADGASEGIFSRAWSALLCESLVAGPIVLGDPEAVAGRVRALRDDWLRRIDYPSRRYTQQAKVDQTGAAATLLVLRLSPQPPPDPGDALDPTVGDDPYGWRAWAVGDSCLFHAREGRLLGTFPIGASTDFGIAPALVRTRPDTATPAFLEAGGPCRPGDLFLLATDAVAQALLRDVEEGDPPDWHRFDGLDLDAWRAEIDDLRRRRRIVNDDSTLLCLRVV